MSRKLKDRLRFLDADQPATWAEIGSKARPNLHGLLRYPAMMVPSMQGDIIDTILGATGTDCHVVDPFVGSGTIMTESLLRGLDFTGIDINPLAVLVCRAKAAIDGGANVEGAAQTVLTAIRFDASDTVDVEFPGLSKWFDTEAAARLSRVRRSILKVDDLAQRQVLWTVFAETIRVCSNSRTSTYKLHVRAEGDRVDPARIVGVFEANLRQTLERIGAYRALIARRGKARPEIELICDDARRADVGRSKSAHRILVTSPPYGDNNTTIPYGQFSFLALRWIPSEDLGVPAARLIANSHALDTASLGGRLGETEAKVERVRAVSASLDAFLSSAEAMGRARQVRKVANFMADFLDALGNMRKVAPGGAHWVLTTGNRTAGGLQVPFDMVCRDMVCHLGGKPLSSLKRRVAGRRMPSRNNMGDMITAETTLVVEFA